MGWWLGRLCTVAVVRPWRAGEDVPAQFLETTPNGGLWAVLADWSEDWEELKEAGELYVELALAHWDITSGEWTVFEENLPEGYPMVMAADDEGVWLGKFWGLDWDLPPEQRKRKEFRGLSHFDGETWRYYLLGTEVMDVAVAPDGSVWYTTGDDNMLHQLR
jgi:hypothetical protein